MPFPVASRASLRPSFIMLALVAVSAAGCSSDTSRFDSNPFTSGQQTAANAPAPAHSSQSARIESTPHAAPQNTAMASPASPAPNYGGSTSYQPAATAQQDITGSTASRQWDWNGGTAITVGQGDTLDTLSKRYGVPASAIMQANALNSPTGLHAGQRLVIPRYNQSTAGSATRTASQPINPGRTTTAKAPAPAAKPAPVQTAQPQKPAPAQPTKVASAEPTQTASLAKPTADVSADDAKGSGAPSFRWPVRGRIITGFGPKPNGQQNDGINLSVPEGTPIKASEDGVVAYAGNELKGYGNLVLIRHSNGFVTAYAHASELTVKRGDTIKRGQTIGKAGQTGTVTSPQLHFEIRKGSSPVDPTQYLNGA
jgi:murein DD-endopeptidase MepM/ murein hydrolase activator NlpD